MRVSIVVKDIKKTVEAIVHALANRLTAQENFGPTGLTGVRVLTSLSDTQIPTWETLDVEGGIGGTPGIQGPKGDKGDPGDDADPADVVAEFDRILTADFGNLGGLEVMVGNDGNVMWV